MDNIRELKIKYEQLLSLLKNSSHFSFDTNTAGVYNSIIDEVVKLTEKNSYKNFLLNNQDTYTQFGKIQYFSDNVKSKLSLVVGSLKGELGIDDSNNLPQTMVSIVNKLENTFAVKIEQTINELIEKEGDELKKQTLSEVDEAIKIKDKNRIGEIFKKMIDNGWFDLLFKIIPEILKRLNN